MQKEEKLIIGVDEVGRGCIAGPVIACAAILPEGFVFEKLRDSKKMSEKNREAFYEYATENGASFGIGIASVIEIEQYNIRRATHIAMHRAIEHLVQNFEFVEFEKSHIYIDGNDFDTRESWSYETLVGGDDIIPAISAASCYAKVYRDRFMKNASENYQDRYHWSTNAGYGTRQHKEALQQYGMTPMHRPSFVKTLLSK